MANSNLFLPDVTEAQISENLNKAKDYLEEALDSHRNRRQIELLQKLVSQNSGKKPPVWVFSTGRCGTFALHSFMQKSDSIAPYHRRGRPLFNRNEVFYGFAFGLCNPQWVEEACFDYLTDQTIGELISSQLCERQFVSLDNHQTAWIPIILKAFPDAEFVHLIREPRDEISSWAKKNLYNHNQITPVMIPRSQFGEYRSFKSAPCNLDLLVQLAWHWRVLNLYIDRSLALLGTNSFLMKSEDLYAADGKVYDELATICDLGHLDYTAFKEHLSVKHNEMSAKGPLSWVSRDSFQSGWTRPLGETHGQLMMKFGYNYI